MRKEGRKRENRVCVNINIYKAEKTVHRSSIIVLLKDERVNKGRNKKKKKKKRETFGNISKNWFIISN